jgi:hypothetical protein
MGNIYTNAIAISSSWLPHHGQPSLLILGSPTGEYIGPNEAPASMMPTPVAPMVPQKLRSNTLMRR